MSAPGLTYLFTDVEGSTRLIQELGSVYGLALQTQRRILTSRAEEHGGEVIRGSEGDGSFFMFGNAARAIEAAVAAQQALHRGDSGAADLRVRMGIHTGVAVMYGGEHVGLNVHIAARVCSAAHGGQVLCTGATARSAGVLDGLMLKDLGAFRLRGIAEPHALLQVRADGLPDDFPPPRGGVREGGAHVTIWRRGDDRRAAGVPDGLLFVATDGAPLPSDVRVEFGTASIGAGAFRITVLRGGVVEEEFDGLTVGGASDAATIVNAYSAIIRVARS